MVSGSPRTVVSCCWRLPIALLVIKVAGRIIETASRVRIAFIAAYPEASLFSGIARSLQPARP